jgi:hypothetical protein
MGAGCRAALVLPPRFGMHMVFMALMHIISRGVGDGDEERDSGS